jgi:hypothetical protein
MNFIYDEDEGLIYVQHSLGEDIILDEDEFKRLIECVKKEKPEWLE